MLSIKPIDFAYCSIAVGELAINSADCFWKVISAYILNWMVGTNAEPT